jgi:hypothetical protein
MLSPRRKNYIFLLKYGWPQTEPDDQGKGDSPENKSEKNEH